jgi:archaemetzincin
MERPLPRSSGPEVEVVPLGAVPMLACSVAAAHLQTVLGLDACVAPAWPAPTGSLLAPRQQHDAAQLLTALARDLDPARLRVGVTGVDLCLPILSYLFGEARVGGRVAVVSLYRLGTRGVSSEAEVARRYERLAKVTVHEAAHALGLTHCRQTGCVMRGAPSVEALDDQSLRLCAACQAALLTLRRAWPARPVAPTA